MSKPGFLPRRINLLPLWVKYTAPRIRLCWGLNRKCPPPSETTKHPAISSKLREPLPRSTQIFETQKFLPPGPIKIVQDQGCGRKSCLKLSSLEGKPSRPRDCGMSGSEHINISTVAVAVGPTNYYFHLQFMALLSLVCPFSCPMLTENCNYARHSSNTSPQQIPRETLT